MIKKSSLLILLILVFAVLFPLGIMAGEGSVNFQVSPKGPVNYGDEYKVVLTVYADDAQTKLCQNCPVKLRFEQEEGGVVMQQPGDEILQSSRTTDGKGQTEARVTSYGVNPKTKNRLLYADVTLPDGRIYTSSPYVLNYWDIPLLGFMRLVTKVVSQGYGLPPFGNIYVFATKQIYRGGFTREVFLKWNTPLGTRKSNIYILSQENGRYVKRLIKTTKDAQSVVEVDAFEVVNLRVEVCSKDTACVDNQVRIPAITDPINASRSAELAVPNYGLLGDYEVVKKQMEEEQGFISSFFGSIGKWLEGIYSSF